MERGRIETFQEYQKATGRTRRSTRDWNGMVSNFALGLCGESGEVADRIKKVVYHGHAADQECTDYVAKELGDILWYVASLAAMFGLDMGDIAAQNIEKLAKRYPEGFSSERSINREE